jgi:hypothetical protein
MASREVKGKFVAKAGQESDWRYGIREKMNFDLAL